MKAALRLKPITLILVIYVSCSILRALEYMFLRTDQTIIGEAFVHKLVGILILATAVRYLSLCWRDIGFTKKAPIKKVAQGLLLGAISFAIAYGAEILLLAVNGNVPSLRIYVTGYSVSGNRGSETGLLFFVMCVAGNIINVMMEEGVFRGLFIGLSERRYSFANAVLISSTLFGLWHIAAPVRSLLDGEMNATQAAVMSLMLVLFTGVAGVKFCLLTRLSGSLWMPMGDHFFNNTIINTLHVVTASGTDTLQIVRISVAQTLSFILVLLIYWKTGARYKQTFRGLKSSYYTLIF
ncbi:lysostaphin resistance A-like protein [Oscillospiraceae bacterium LTW-04]|nr:CPBP family intramembrane glutamic endopeptidase [Oscillospiraceae bacterium MB24-C1]